MFYYLILSLHARAFRTPDPSIVKRQNRGRADPSRPTLFSGFSWIRATYAGNTLLMKKGNHRFASDSAMYKHQGEE